MGLKSVTPLHQHVQDASKERLVVLLSRVASWTVNINDPQDTRNRIEALGLVNKIQRGDADHIEIARTFLFNLCQDVRAQDFDEEDA